MKVPEYYGERVNVKGRKFDCINVIAACVSAYAGTDTGGGMESFYMGNIIKYLWRAGEKDTIESDVKKALHYMELLINYSGYVNHDVQYNPNLKADERVTGLTLKGTVMTEGDLYGLFLETVFSVCIADLLHGENALAYERLFMWYDRTRGGGGNGKCETL